MFLVGLLIVAAMTGGFAASVALMLRRWVPRLKPASRRWIAPIAGACMALSPAILSSAKESAGAFISVILMAALLAVICGYPAVRFFDTPPKTSA